MSRLSVICFLVRFGFFALASRDARRLFSSLSISSGRNRAVLGRPLLREGVVDEFELELPDSPMTWVAVPGCSTEGLMSQLAMVMQSYPPGMLESHSKKTDW